MECDRKNKAASIRVDEVERIAREINHAKAVIAPALDRLKDLELLLIAIIGTVPDGTTVRKTPHFTIKTEHKLNRGIDPDQVIRLFLSSKFPEALYRRLFAWHPELQSSELRFIELNEPEHFQMIADAIIESPPTTTLIIEERKAGE